MMGSKFVCDNYLDCKDPWLLTEGRSSISGDSVYIARTIEHIKNNRSPLTLVVDEGKTVQDSLLVNIDGGSLLIDKPLEWADEPPYFKVFFRDRDLNWNYFSTDKVVYSPFTISVAMPKVLHYLQKRVCHRVKVPVGTRALVKSGDQAISTVFVHDLSASGMLMYSDPSEGEYTTDSIINDIVVSIPASREVGDDVGKVRKVLPLIGQGRIVRSYVDRETRRPCYGVSFQYDSSYVREVIDQIVSEVENGSQGELHC